MKRYSIVLIIFLSLVLGSFFVGHQSKTVIFVSGLGLHSQDYITIVSSLRDNGYTVLLYNPKYKNTDDYGQMIDVWTRGVGRLAGNKKVIVLGHSVGGGAAVHFCATDKRCIAGVNMDGSPSKYEKLSVPFLYLQAEPGRYCEQDCLNARKLMEKIAADSGSEVIKLRDIKHFNFVDAALKPDKDLISGDYVGTVDGKKGLEIITRDLLLFLQKHT
jgi:hypothetical protein